MEAEPNLVFFIIIIGFEINYVNLKVTVKNVLLALKQTTSTTINQ